MQASWGIGLLCLRQGNLHRALSMLDRAVDICQDADLPHWFPELAATLGPAYTLGGRLTDAVPLLTQPLEWAMAAESPRAQARCRRSL